MGLLRKLLKAICASVAVFVGVLLGPNPLPESVKFTEFQVAPVKDFGRHAANNELLNNAERLFEDEIKGPEAFEVLNGELYTTLHGGFVAKVFDDQVIPVVSFGEPCVGWWEESKCGRPLGIKALGNDHLIIADAYFGIHKYNINTRKSVALVDKNILIDGRTPKTFNSVEVAKDGTIYWTHSSSDFSIENALFTFLADGSGRLIAYDPATKRNTVLLRDLNFANGLALSPNEDFLLVSETGNSRVLKYHLKGPKKFTVEVFIDGLPGMSDNLRRNGNNGFFIPLVTTKSEKNFLNIQELSQFPKLRTFAARFLSLIQLSLDKIHNIHPNYYTQRALHYVGHLESVGMLLPKKASVLEVDLNGNVVRAYHCLDGSVTTISDVIPHNGYLYLGSPVNNYLARVKLSKLGIEAEVKRPLPSAPRTETRRPTTRSPPTTTTTPKPTTRPPPPTTTTPKPTTRSPPPTTTTPKPPTRSPPSTTTTPKPPTRSPPSTTTPKPPTRSPPPTTTTPKPTTKPSSPPTSDTPKKQQNTQRKTDSHS